MKQSTKAALLSALVFPGAGHLFLKRYISAILLIGISCAALYTLISQTLEQSLQLAEKIQGADGQLDVAALSEFLNKQASATESQSLEIASIAFILCWLIGIIDAYRIAHVPHKK